MDVVVAVSAAMVVASCLGLGLSSIESLRGGLVAVGIQMAVVDAVAVMVAEDCRWGSEEGRRQKWRRGRGGRGRLKEDGDEDDEEGCDKEEDEDRTEQ